MGIFLHSKIFFRLLSIIGKKEEKNFQSKLITLMLNKKMIEKKY